jgi:hypothetical protein
MTSGQAAVATAAEHFPRFDNNQEEIYLTCMPHKMGRQIEISPGSWAEILPLFSVIEVRKRRRAVQDQAAVSNQATVSDKARALDQKLRELSEMFPERRR